MQADQTRMFQDETEVCHNFCRVRSENHPKFPEECAMFTVKHDRIYSA